MGGWKILGVIVLALVVCILLFLLTRCLRSGYLQKIKVLLPEQESSLKREPWDSAVSAKEWIEKLPNPRRWYILINKPEITVFDCSGTSVTQKVLSEIDKKSQFLKGKEDGLYSLGKEY